MTRLRTLFWGALVMVLAMAVLLGFRACMDSPVSKGGAEIELAIGRSLGLLAVALLLLQPILAVRPRALERVFGLDRLLVFHRLSAVLCLGAGFLHPMFVYSSGLRSAGPSGWHLWPEAIGAIALLGVWALVVSSLYRDFVLLRWEVWRTLHVILASVSVLALTTRLSSSLIFAAACPLCGGPSCSVPGWPSSSGTEPCAHAWSSHEVGFP